MPFQVRGEGRGEGYIVLKPNPNPSYAMPVLAASPVIGYHRADLAGRIVVWTMAYALMAAGPLPAAPNGDRGAPTSTTAMGDAVHHCALRADDTHGATGDDLCAR